MGPGRIIQFFLFYSLGFPDMCKVSGIGSESLLYYKRSQDKLSLISKGYKQFRLNSARLYTITLILLTFSSFL